MKIFDYICYRKFLKELLTKKIITNSSYSLRAFSKKLQISPSFLSQVLAKKKDFSVETADAVSNILFSDDTEQKYFKTMVLKEISKSKRDKKELSYELKVLKKATEILNIDIEKHDILSRSANLFVLAAFTIDDFVVTNESLINKLDIDQNEIRCSLDELESAGFIEKKTDGVYISLGKNILFSSKKKNDYLRKFHKEMLEKASNSIFNQKPNEKYIGSQTFAINKEKMAEAEKYIDSFVNKFVVETTDTKNKTDLYHLGIQFFRISR